MPRRRKIGRLFKRAAKSGRRAIRSYAKNTVKTAKSFSKHARKSTNSVSKRARKATKLYAKNIGKFNKWQMRRQNKRQNRIIRAAQKITHRAQKSLQKQRDFHAANVKGAENSYAAAIINAYRHRAGLPPVFGEKMLDLARKLVAQKVKSVGFLRSGWIEATRAIASKVNTPGLGGSINAGPRGYAKPATVVISGIVAGEIGNTVLLYKRKGGKNFPNPPSRAWTADHDDPSPILIAGLKSAVGEVTYDMERKLVERLSRDWGRIT